VRTILVKRTGIIAMLLAALGCLVVGSASASTTSTSVMVPLPSNVSVAPDNTTDTVVLSTTLTLAAGESRRVSDRLGATLSSTEGAEVDNRIICLDPSGMAVGEAASGTNHPGSGAGEIGLMESLLLEAPVAGVYTCRILARTSDDNRTSFVMTALRGGPQFGTNGTWLRISSADEVGSHAWFNYDCDSRGTSPTCVYLGGSGTPIVAHVFNGPDRDVWTAATDTTQVDVVGIFQITSCPHGTASCIRRHWGDDGWLGLGINRDRYAELYSFIEFNQLNPDGSVCRIHQSNDDTSPTGDSGPGDYHIRDSVHHLPVRYHLTANVSPNCNGSRRFALDLYVRWRAGNPIKLDNGAFNVIQNVRGATTTTVPNVVGMSEAQAVDAIKVRALKPVTVERIMNPALIGSVFAQNSQGGTVEPTDSEVHLSVSLGQVSVPNVIGDTTASATHAIKAAGLTVGQISSVNNCVDPGFVQQQNPRRGTPVIPGTPVNITTATCSSGGGTPGGGNGPPIQPK